ncbi:MAG: hypothetical protein JRM99_08870 [Nitrososphaerota archaeon]|nr:hypothetical protein [Nitrososphaerota archaeon]MDG6991507.1 hypothetical protein [Nitrososphaerota archaeon]
MEFEKLALEVSAIKAGLSTVTPGTLKGASGVVHKFDLLFTDGERKYAFDFYGSVADVEVVKSFAKRFDTGCYVSLIAPAGAVTEQAKGLALFYNMRILTPDAAATYFALEKAAPVGTFG